VSASDSDEAAPFAALVGDWLTGAEYAERAPIVRSGEREPIPAATRFVVHCRDHWRCAWCAFISDPERRNGIQYLEVDHIIPWSAGGSDRSDNLRSLCNVCNTRRSNFVTDSGHARARACVVWCDPCAELLHRAGIDIKHYVQIDPWTLRHYIPNRWTALQEAGEFDIDMSVQGAFAYCFYGNHNSWTASDLCIL
jgi:hypothetical protein